VGSTKNITLALFFRRKSAKIFSSRCISDIREGEQERLSLQTYQREAKPVIAFYSLVEKSVWLIDQGCLPIKRWFMKMKTRSFFRRTKRKVSGVTETFSYLQLLAPRLFHSHVLRRCLFFSRLSYDAALLGQWETGRALVGWPSPAQPNHVELSA